MIKLENTNVVGFEPAIRGMRNPMNSWDKSDSLFEDRFDSYNNVLHYHGIDGTHMAHMVSELDDPSINWGEWKGDCFNVGPNDLDLMKRLAAGGPVHAKYRRMIVVYVDITAPLYWWKEFDTYKVGTVANSCSTMHKIHAKEFELDDFSYERLIGFWQIEDKNDFDNNPIIALGNGDFLVSPTGVLKFTISMLNKCRELYLKTKDKNYWWQMIQLLPSSYNQKRTVMLNYEVLHNIYNSRKDHKLDEWHYFCEWIRELPYADEVIL